MAESVRRLVGEAGTLEYGSYVTGMIAWLSNRLSAQASATYRRLFGIGVMEWRVLAHLAIEPGCTAARVARVIGLDKAAVSRTVGVLLRRGDVVREDGEGRGQVLVLSAGGRALHARVLEVALLREAALLSGLTEAERGMLRGLLNRLLTQVPPGHPDAPRPEAAG